jgi:heterodisulfide reductase subunit A
VGLGVDDGAIGLAKNLGIELDHYHYVKTAGLDPVQTSRPGIYVCGTYQASKDIPSSVIEASAAAGQVGSRLCDVRGTQTKTKETIQETNVCGQSPRIGVFVCCCGTNIAGFVDVPQVVEFAKTLPNVVYAEKNLFSCSQDTQGQISHIIRDHRLNRVVVSACTPKTHELLFQETLINAGLNKYLFEMTNIRNQCSWVHKDDMERATQKAKDLVEMSVAKVTLHEPLAEPKMKMNQAVLVIGGGVAGMIAARNLAMQGYTTFLVEKENRLGGQALHLGETWQGEKIDHFVKNLIEQVQTDENIHVILVVLSYHKLFYAFPQHVKCQYFRVSSNRQR